MKKRFAALLLALAILTSAAAACGQEADTFATCTMPDGAETLDMRSFAQTQAPAGMDQLYAAMANITGQGDVYITRMPKGLALVSIACEPLNRQLVSPDLLNSWDAIRQSLMDEFPGLTAADTDAGLSQLFGREVLVMQATPPGDVPLLLMGIAFPRQEDLIEVWAGIPTEYAADPQALEQDQAAMWAMMSSLSFTTGQAEAAALMEHQMYADPDGAFTVGLPDGCRVMNRATPQQQVDELRSQYLAANPEGADVFFDGFVTDVQDENATVVFSQDLQCVVQFFAVPTEGLQDFTTSDFLNQTQLLEQNLQAKYQYALSMDQGRLFASGLEHARNRLWVRQQDYSVSLDVLACLENGETLREVDLYLPAQNLDAQYRQDWLSLIAQTLQYGSPSN